MEGSVKMENTPPQMVTGVSPTSLKVSTRHFTNGPNDFREKEVADRKGSVNPLDRRLLRLSDSWRH
jgi:hypothetical protein